LGVEVDYFDDDVRINLADSEKESSELGWERTSERYDFYGLAPKDAIFSETWSVPQFTFFKCFSHTPVHEQPIKRQSKNSFSNFSQWR
jgi:hypothetical protein